MKTKRSEYSNKIEYYRRRMGLDVREVATLLGHTDPTAVLSYERGVRYPSLANALGLGIILRVPVEFLFPDLYDAMRLEIRRLEEQAQAQLKLF